MKFSLIPTLPVIAALAAAAQAGDLTVTPKPFEVNADFGCTAVPTDARPLEIDPEEWGSFQIEKILPHGAKVEKDAVLIKFKDEALDRKLEDSRNAVKTTGLALANARTALAAQKSWVPIQLAAAKAAADRVAADLEDFVKKSRPASEEGARQALKRAKQKLAAEQEELKQLLAMYKADDLTDETEEFILKRQRNSVESAKFGVRMQELETERTLKVDLPRKGEDFERAAANAKTTYAKTKAELPRTIETKQLEADAADLAHKRAIADLAQLEADAKNRVLKAPVAGRFYYGAFVDGQWQTKEFVKSLVKGGTVPVNKPFATVIPKDAKLSFAARVGQAAVRDLAPGRKGRIVVKGFEERPLKATVKSVAAVPGADRLFMVELEAETPADLPLLPGMAAKVSVPAYHSEKALVVPAKALHENPDRVEVRLADGGSELREVKTGRRKGEEVEILSGLEAGQAIVVPDKK